MWEKLNTVLNIVISSSIGVFLGHGIYVFWDYRKRPDLYAMWSAPWYTGIFVYGIFTAAVIAAALIFKLIIGRKIKKR